MSISLFAAGLACFGAGGLCDLFFGVRSACLRPVPYLFGMAGSACLTVLGIHATTTAPLTVDLHLLFGIGRSGLRIDQLAGLFLTLLFGVAVAVSALLRVLGAARGSATSMGVSLRAISSCSPRWR